MASWNNPQTPRPGVGASPSLDGRTAGQVGYDTGLRKHMLSIYNYMASGVLLTGVVAMLFAIVISLPLGIWLLAPLRRRATAGIAQFDERRRSDREQLQARLRGEAGS